MTAPLTSPLGGDDLAKALRDAYGRGFKHHGGNPVTFQMVEAYEAKRDAWIAQYIARLPAAEPIAASSEAREDWSHLSPQEIVRRTRCQADDRMFPDAWRACCDLILRRLKAAPAASPDLKAEARAALARMNAREGEDVDEWAEQLAADSVRIGEAEYVGMDARAGEPQDDPDAGLTHWQIAEEIGAIAKDGRGVTATVYAAIERAWLRGFEAGGRGAPFPEAGAGGDLGELERLSAKATPGPWRHIAGDDYFIESDSYPPKATHNPCVIDSGWWLAVGNRPDDFGEANSRFIVALVNAFRDGKLVASTGSEEETKGASFGPGSCPSGPTASRSSGFAAAIPSRGLSADEKLKQREALEDWLVQNAGIGTWAARTTARALLLREDSPFAGAACFAGHMTEATALLDMVERHKLAVSPQCNGGWVIEGSSEGIDDAQEYDLARTRKGLRSALRLAASELEHPLPPPGALAGEAAQAAETGGLGSRASDGEAGTPEATPKSSPGQTPVDPQMTVEEAEQRITNLHAARQSALRQMNEQAARAEAAEQRCIELERGAIHPALAVDVQQHRDEAYRTGWDDGYAEGHAKALAPSDAPSTTEADR